MYLMEYKKFIYNHPAGNMTWVFVVQGNVTVKIGDVETLVVGMPE